MLKKLKCTDRVESLRFLLVDPDCMSAFRDLVMGQGCTVEAEHAGNNPLAKLFSGLLDSTQKHEQIPRLPDMHITSIDREKIANRASVVTRHVFPGEEHRVV